MEPHAVLDLLWVLGETAFDGLAHAEGRGALAGRLVAGGQAAGPRPTNLVLIGGGAADEAELCAPVQRGIYITRLWYANVLRPTESLFTAITRDGTFLIEDGQIAGPLDDMRITDSALSILSHVQALGAHSVLTCDGELYARRFASGAVCPPLRAEGVRFSG
jgi:predicted Zn-dependent protease